MTLAPLTSSHKSSCPLGPHGLKEGQLELDGGQPRGQGLQKLQGVAADVGQWLPAVQLGPGVHPQDQRGAGKGFQEVHAPHYRA
jgi:hypothetical protein